MTNEEREQVAELLRCAADISETGRFGFNPLTRAESMCGYLDADEMELDETIWMLAEDAARKVASENGVVAAHDLGVALYLEAAQRVEEGSWP